MADNAGVFDQAMATVGRLAAAAEAFAAVAAAVRFHCEGLEIDEATGAALDAAAQAVGVGPQSIATFDAQQAGTIVAMARSLLGQAVQLIDSVGRPPGWSPADPTVLQSTGRLSMGIAPALQSVPVVGDDLAREGAAFLDVGTGVGLLAVALARTFPTMRVTGIDVYDPSLELARRNVAQADLGDRVVIRAQDVTTLDEPGTFDGVWLPGPFLPHDVCLAAIDRGAAALRTGGWLILGFYPVPDEPLGRALVDLRVVRGGGHPWRPDEAAASLVAAGLTDVHVAEITWSAPVVFVVGRKQETT